MIPGEATREGEQLRSYEQLRRKDEAGCDVSSRPTNLFACGASSSLRLALITCVMGCGTPAARTPQNSPKPAAHAAEEASQDGSRCKHEGAPDLDVAESVGSGSLQHNIRRVYRVSGEGEARRRVLVCREVDTNLDGRKDLFRRYNDQGHPLEELADSNYDGVIDTWIRFDKGQVIQVEVDEAWDGQPDERRHYVRGKLTRIERDTDQNGATDVWEYYVAGRLDRIGVDLNHDGRVDRWSRDSLASREQQQGTDALSATSRAAADDEDLSE